MPVTKNCIKCGEVFEVKPYRAKSQRYCNFDCYLEDTQTKLLLRCKVCSKPFFANRNQKRSCCSKACKHISQRKLPMENPCEWCGKMVRRNNHTRKKYCNEACYKEHLRHKKMMKYRKVCECCLQTYYDTERRNPKRRFCSKSCSSTRKGKDETYLLHRLT